MQDLPSPLLELEVRDSCLSELEWVSRQRTERNLAGREATGEGGDRISPHGYYCC